MLLGMMIAATSGCGEELVDRRPPPQLVGDGRVIAMLDAGHVVGDHGALIKKDSGAAKKDTSAPKKDSSMAKPDTGGGVQLSAKEKDLLDAINAARVKLGLSTLVPDPMLMCAARLAAKVIPPTGSCGHVGSDGSWPNDRAKSCGMNSADAWKVNEIAAGPGFTDGADAVWGWSQSAGHWWGLTHPKATKIGTAATASGCYWAVFDCCIQGSE
jgi:uncharacterized protein YkwD